MLNIGYVVPRIKGAYFLASAVSQEEFSSYPSTAALNVISRPEKVIYDLLSGTID